MLIKMSHRTHTFCKKKLQQKSESRWSRSIKIRTKIIDELIDCSIPQYSNYCGLVQILIFIESSLT